MRTLRTHIIVAIVMIMTFNCGASNQNDLYGRDDIMAAPQFAVYFTDKNNTPYSIDRPLEFLSQKSLDRRALRGIAVNEADLPVNPEYTAALSAAGAYVRWTSRWENLAIVHAYDNAIEQIRSLSFVDSVVYVKPSMDKAKEISDNVISKWDNETIQQIPEDFGNSDYVYGLATEQIEQLNGIAVHQRGYDGEGVLVAVLDAGFEHVNVISAFDSLFDNGRIVYTTDVVEKGGNIYRTGINQHGTLVLSTMGGYLPQQFVGTAPQASYALIRTEDSKSEYPVEEYNWLIGAELADSIGADVVNTSLGYTEFDNPIFDVPFSTMDGKTYVSSRAVTRLTERGVFVVISAGNSNGSSWPWVGTPSDAVEGLTVGAVMSNGVIAGFSSIGPNGSGDPKPNTVALGVDAAVVASDGYLSFASGTSFSSPITCGMVACLVQARPDLSPLEMLSMIEQNSDRYPSHDIRYGYGIPDFDQVLSSIVDGIDSKSFANTSYVFPNPTDDVVTIISNDVLINTIHVIDMVGRIVNDVDVYNNSTSIDLTNISGVVVLRIEFANGNVEQKKVVVTR